MALVRPDVNSFARIKVVGVGGGGNNVINSMIANQNVRGVDFIAINTDSQALLSSQAPIKLQIGDKLTKGLGSGANPDIGRKAAEESAQPIQEMLADADMVFITCGMGGGTGTGASPIIAELAKATGALTVAVVTKPFLFEGTRRMVVADDGIEELRGKVDTLIVIPNQKLLETVEKTMTLLEAFKISDSVLGEGVQGISDLITTPGLINVDFADVKTIMSSSGTALMGIGTGSGEGRAAKAAREAISSPILEVSIEGAKGILFNITAGRDLTMQDVNEAAEIISSTADTDANIIFGTTIDETLKDEVKVTVIATGFDENRTRYTQFTGAQSIRPQQLQEMPQQTQPAQQAPQAPQQQPSPSQGIPVLNTFMRGAEQPVSQQPPQQVLPVQNQVSETNDDFSVEDDEFDIPAFLRQKK